MPRLLDLTLTKRRDLERVKRLVAEGADVKERDGFDLTVFLRACNRCNIPIMHWLLTEGGSSVAEQAEHGQNAFLLAAEGTGEHFATMQYLIEHGTPMSRKVWETLGDRCYGGNDAHLSSLLKVMVMLDDAPAEFIGELLPHHAKLCKQGRQLRARLPSYLEQQRAAVVTHCPLPAVLQSLVNEYAATTPEDMWADGLRVRAPRAKRGRTEASNEDGEAAPSLRRSLRQRQQ
jgi:ankyrin repeat protein